MELCMSERFPCCFKQVPEMLTKEQHGNVSIILHVFNGDVLFGGMELKCSSRDLHGAVSSIYLESILIVFFFSPKNADNSSSDSDDGDEDWVQPKKQPIKRQSSQTGEQKQKET